MAVLLKVISAELCHSILNGGTSPYAVHFWSIHREPSSYRLFLGVFLQIWSSVIISTTIPNMSDLTIHISFAKCVDETIFTATFVATYFTLTIIAYIPSKGLSIFVIFWHIGTTSFPVTFQKETEITNFTGLYGRLDYPANSETNLFSSSLFVLYSLKHWHSSSKSFRRFFFSSLLKNGSTWLLDVRLKTNWF